MRQRRSLPTARRQPEPDPPPPPSRWTKLRVRFGRLNGGLQTVLLLVAGVFIALAVFLVYDSFEDARAPRPLTQREINAAVARALASATPKPSDASQAFQIIRPSLTRVQALVADGDDKPGVSLGAGVVIDDAGDILSSLHIAQEATRVRVTFADGTESDATVVIRQRENDLMVLKPDIIPDDLMPATLASAAMLQEGDEVFAVGNPFGISNSLSAGVVSGLGRNYKSPKGGEDLRNLIQFDAAVNPGNSGGPLVNRDGEVIGIVTALLNPTEQDVFIGIGFAVPIETAAGALGTPPD